MSSRLAWSTKSANEIKAFRRNFSGLNYFERGSVSTCFLEICCLRTHPNFLSVSQTRGPAQHPAKMRKQRLSLELRIPGAGAHWSEPFLSSLSSTSSSSTTLSLEPHPTWSPRKDWNFPPPVKAWRDLRCHQPVVSFPTTPLL